VKDRAANPAGSGAPLPIIPGTGGRERAILCSTRQVATAHRRAYWQAAVSKALPGLDVEWFCRDTIDARLFSHPFGRARITEIQNTPARVIYEPLKQGPDSLQLVLHLAGPCAYTHRGREITQAPGSLILLDSTAPFTCAFRAGVHVLIWELPREAVPVGADALARGISGDVGLGAVLAGHARTLASESASLSPPAQEYLQRELCGLVALAFDDSERAMAGRFDSWQELRCRQLLAYIETHLGDERLSVKSAARDLGISRRWVHEVLRQRGLRFAAWVARRRVEECRKMLANPAFDHLSIAEIAFQWGFRDLSTFNRQFRRLCAMTPRDVRRLRR